MPITAYDQVPYPCNAYPQTHPEHLASIARLRGLQTPAPESCRYLEIGCGDGGNLLPLAHAMPQARFFGIDLAATSIETARKHAQAVGISNVEFQALDLMNLDTAQWGQWDFIVAHGVFSWVPEPARRRLLQVCRDMLSPKGVAFISYNAQPGSHIRQMARDMMCYHTDNAPDAGTKIAQARALMGFLAHSHGSDDEYGALLRAEAARVQQFAPNHLFHDDLAAINQPYYLHEFVDLATSGGLQYLGDADYASMFATRYSKEVREHLAELGSDFLKREQYLDFIKCRRFRQSLLCHQDVQLQDSAPAGLMREFHFASSARPTSSSVNLLDESEVIFEGQDGLRGEAALPIAKLPLAYLGLKWPARISFSELHQAASQALGSEIEEEALAVVLREFIEMGAVEAHLSPAPYATQLEERPTASPWALYQQKQGPGGITTLRHQTIHIQDSFGQWLLGQIDGSRTMPDIAHALASTVKPDQEGRLNFDKELQEAADLVHEGLKKFLQLGLLSRSQIQP